MNIGKFALINYFKNLKSFKGAWAFYLLISIALLPLTSQ